MVRHRLEENRSGTDLLLIGLIAVSQTVKDERREKGGRTINDMRESSPLIYRLELVRSRPHSHPLFSSPLLSFIHLLSSPFSPFTYCPPEGKSKPIILSWGFKRAVYTAKLAGLPVREKKGEGGKEGREGSVTVSVLVSLCAISAPPIFHLFSLLASLFSSFFSPSSPPVFPLLFLLLT